MHKQALYKAALLLCLLAPWIPLHPGGDSRSLSFFHTHTDEELAVTFYANGEYVAEALAKLNHFLRDFRTGDETRMDPPLFDILFDIQQTAGSSGTYHVISGFRSEETNKMLRQRSSGVASNSQHLKGKAIDVRLTDLDTARLRDIALALKRGGVGYYNKLDFVHVDTGRVRRW